MDENSNSTVRFPVSAVVHPHPNRILAELFGDHELEGTVVAETTDGMKPFLLVRVNGLSDAVIVPQNKSSSPPAALTVTASAR